MQLAEAAVRGADVIQRNFAEYHGSFLAATRRVRTLFEHRDWAGVRRETVDRMHLQSGYVARALEEVRGLVGRAGLAPDARETWHELKGAFSHAVLGREEVELAKTFFNSLTRKVFSHVGVDPRIDYQSDDIPLPFRGWEMASARMYDTHAVDAAVVRRILEDARFETPFAHLGEDAALAAARIEAATREHFGVPGIESLDFLAPVFFRNKGAYLVGRARRGGSVMPLLLALLHGDDGLVVDAVLPAEDDASIVFSFARWYFHVDVASPREVIGFLQSILPRKRIAELYISLGYNKHGKTEFYRDLVGQIGRSDEELVVARGQRGLVMAVFTLPSFDWVFKIIKDRFPPQKSTTRWQVMERYRQVLQQDRVGRMVDFQEFEHLPLPRERFSASLLAELLEMAGDTVHDDGDRVVLDHCYVERRVTPLDVFLREAPPAAAEAVVVDYGNCLRDLAAANVFPGDLLLKNFGVTRHGRVVFYDYDELAPLVDCRFRELPAEADEPGPGEEPSFYVGPHDVFPEEFERFLGLKGELRAAFLDAHGELLKPRFWLDMQQRIRAGEYPDFYPYPAGCRLHTAVRA
jgi:isocitrate dehydrogenase kinase/phosphatase